MTMNASSGSPPFRMERRTWHRAMCLATATASLSLRHLVPVSSDVRLPSSISSK
jgi:hypothetical protein